MRSIRQLFASTLILLAAFCISASAQLTSVSQLKDVKTTDKYYAAVKSLVEKYGVLEAYPDGTFRGSGSLTREQFIILLNNSLDRLSEVHAASISGDEPEDDDLGILGLINVPYDVNKTNITSVSQIKDLRPTDAHYSYLESLVERYGINLVDADKNFRPTKVVTENELYTWIAGIFRATAGGTPSATMAISRGDWAIVMNDALDSIVNKFTEASEAKAQRSKSKIILGLPSKGRAQIVKQFKFYLPGSGCPNLSAADDNLKKYAADNEWGDYRIKKGDVGDILYETNNTCSKGGKIIMLRVGTAIVTMMEEGIKRIK